MRYGLRILQISVMVLIGSVAITICYRFLILLLETGVLVHPRPVESIRAIPIADVKNFFF